MDNWFPELDNKPGEVVLEVKNFTSPNPMSFQDCSFQLRRGEILGLGGLVGAQRTELMEALFGIRSIKSGEVYMMERRSPSNHRRMPLPIKSGF